MKTWPRSAVIALIAVSLCWMGTTVYLWTASNENYRKVGINDGSIAERHKLIEHLKSIAPLSKCADWPAGSRGVVVVSVKSEQVNARVDDAGSLRLCEY